MLFNSDSFAPQQLSEQFAIVLPPVERRITRGPEATMRGHRKLLAERLRSTGRAYIRQL